MTEMIRTAAGDDIHPLDDVQRRRWRMPTHAGDVPVGLPSADLPPGGAGR